MTPTRSEVENWDTEHLDAAADHWSKTATVWEDHFSHYANQVANPGGTPWEGEAAEAAQQQAHSDRLIVCGLADQLHEASRIARQGANELKEACRLVMRSVHSAEDDGFTVGQDFSVTDDKVYSRVAAAYRQGKAEEHATAIRAAVADLVAADTRIATELTTAASGLGQDHFGEQTGGSAGDETSQPNIGDKLLGNVVAESAQQPQLSNSLLANVAGGGDNANSAAQSVLYKIGKAAMGEKKDWLFATSSAYASTLLNGAADLARPGAAEAPSWVQKTVKEFRSGKLNFGTAGGLGLSGMFQGVSLAVDLKKPDAEMSTAHAYVRNGAALIANTLAQAPFDATVVGIPAGIVAGAMAANAAAATVDAVWDPLAESKDIFMNAGGPGAAMKHARWGW